MKTETETKANITRAQTIAVKIMNWDMENVLHLYGTFCALMEALQNTPLELADFINRNDVPSMPYPTFGYTHIIWAIDNKGQALVGNRIPKIVSIYDIIFSESYQRAKELYTDILYWNQKDATELRDLVSALRAIIADPYVTVSDIAGPEKVPSACFQDYIPHYKIWGVDQIGYALIGEEAEEIKAVEDVICDAIMAQAEQIATDIKAWDRVDVTQLRDMIKELETTLTNGFLPSDYCHPADLIDITSLPDVDILNDLLAEKYWRIDQFGNALTDDLVNKTMTFQEWRVLQHA